MRDERAQAHLGQRAGFARRDVTVHVRDHALGQVVRFDLVRENEPDDLRGEPIVAADHAPQEPFVPEVIESLVLTVPLTRGVDERQAARRAHLEKALFQREEQLLGNAVPAVAGGAQHVAIVKHGDGVLDGYDLLQHGVTPWEASDMCGPVPHEHGRCPCG